MKQLVAAYYARWEDGKWLAASLGLSLHSCHSCVKVIQIDLLLAVSQCHYMEWVTEKNCHYRQWLAETNCRFWQHRLRVPPKSRICCVGGISTSRPSGGHSCNLLATLRRECSEQRLTGIINNKMPDGEWEYPVNIIFLTFRWMICIQGEGGGSLISVIVLDIKNVIDWPYLIRE